MPSLMTELRDATRDTHRRLENLPFAKALEAGDLPMTSYIGYLRTLGVVYSVLEHELPVEADDRIAEVWDDAMRKLPVIQRDLNHLAAREPRDIPAAHAAAQTVANCLLQRAAEQPVAMLGYLYVLEGSSLGAVVIAPWVKRAFALENGCGTAYLEGYGDTTQARWEAFKARMDGLELTPAERTAIVEAAIEAFEGIQDILSALHPFEPDSLAVLAASLNPEAGIHPIPQDPRELEAARQAGIRSLQAYPYFVWRYGERGRRFTDSDGAWLVTLEKYPQARIDRQVAWLGGLLATRGMPRILLQRHLELLYEELILRVPEKQDRYAKLLAAADRLAEARRARIGDADLERIDEAFERAAGPDWRARLPGSGMILTGAVADEHAGLEGTLASVREWFGDPARFPSRWIEAVEQCIAEAEAALVG